MKRVNIQPMNKLPKLTVSVKNVKAHFKPLSNSILIWYLVLMNPRISSVIVVKWTMIMIIMIGIHISLCENIMPKVIETSGMFATFVVLS
jgi:hypothetical protein